MSLWDSCQLALVDRFRTRVSNASLNILTTRFRMRQYGLSASRRCIDGVVDELRRAARAKRLPRSDNWRQRHPDSGKIFFRNGHHQHALTPINKPTGWAMERGTVEIQSTNTPLAGSSAFLPEYRVLAKQEISSLVAIIAMLVHTGWCPFLLPFSMHRTSKGIGITSVQYGQLM